MNLQELKEILQQTKRSSASPDLRRMVDSFEEFLSLYMERHQVHTDQQGFLNQLNESYRTMWECFETVATAHGLSGQVLQQYFANPSNFTPEQWQGLETLKQDVASLGSPSAKQKQKRQSKHHKKAMV